MIDVFICYAKEDQSDALRLYRDLRAEGLEVWLDVKDLDPGVPWREVTRMRIRESKYVLVLLSPKSVSKRGFVQAEIKEALDASKEIPAFESFLIPVRIAECAIPPQLANLHYADLFPPAAYHDTLRRLIVTMRSGQGELAVPISVIPALPEAPARWRWAEFIVRYFQVLISLTATPKRSLRKRNEPLRSNLIAAVEFMAISAVPYSIFNALLPLNATAVVYHFAGYLFINVLLAFGSSWAIYFAWRLFGAGSPYLRYAIINAYYCGAVFFLGFINVMLAVGGLKLLDKKVLGLLRGAAGGNVWPLLDGRLLHNRAVVAALWILGAGHVLLLLWTFIFWGSYREINQATKVTSFGAWLLASILVLPVGLIAALLQQALFNFVDVAVASGAR